MTRLRILAPYWPALPALLVASGPPVLRRAGRSSLATLNGVVDMWILIQLFVYGGALALSVYFLRAKLVTGLPSRHGPAFAVAALLVFSCALSGLWSSALTPTVALSLLMGTGLVIGVQFASSMSAEGRDFFSGLLWLRWLSLALGLLVFACYYFRITFVSEHSPTGLRVRGGHVAVLGLCGMVGVIVSAYRLMFMTRRLFILDAAFIGAGMVALYYARTRSLFVALGISLLIMAWFYFRDARTTRVMLWRLSMSIIAVGIMSGAVLLQGHWLENQWTRGNSESISNLSSRTFIWGYTIEEVIKQPWGYGYTTGFRDLFDRMNWFRQLQFEDASGMNPNTVGEAHNSHLEFLVGPGWIGFFLYLSLIAILWRRMWFGVRLAHTEDALHSARVCLALFIGFLADGMTTSAYGLPLHQPFGYLVYVCALGLAVESAARTAAIELRPGAAWQPNALSVPGGPGGHRVASGPMTYTVRDAPDRRPRPLSQASLGPVQVSHKKSWQA